MKNEVYVCGYNGFFTLGTGDVNISIVPVRINHESWLSNKIVDISSGQWHNCITTEDGRCQTFGYNHYSQLALPHNKDTSVPTTASKIATYHIIDTQCGNQVCHYYMITNYE